MYYFPALEKKFAQNSGRAGIQKWYSAGHRRASLGNHYQNFEPFKVNLVQFLDYYVNRDEAGNFHFNCITEEIIGLPSNNLNPQTMYDHKFSFLFRFFFWLMITQYKLYTIANDIWPKLRESWDPKKYSVGHRKNSKGYNLQNFDKMCGKYF